MIAEFTAAMAAIKETASLAKVISDAKTEAEVNAAVSDMISKLTSVQRECMSLVELARSFQDENVTLKAKIAEFENFKADSEGYTLNKTEAGTLVYTVNKLINGEQVAVNACPHCFQQKKISILQPGVDKAVKGYHLIHFCPSCRTEFKMGKVPPIQESAISRLAR
ncbi:MULTISPECIES: hypothetical protein [Lelliottia]|uniref:Uncharacterized protein n=1 Tax=Lelliottia aquatilis TaxID=2080838 RepID=A0ABX5A2V1_9ENTR|nr:MULTISPECIES: hypothetical protein [Lelliottia]POZ14086.1 hypothetical protein C3Z09_20125 [Lelliottia aquatilis]POZ23988.1 hypothetical protein C3712_07130 [Lelliottia aquatilis]POZ27610.1 hypothetical protein C3708_08525 [Lelliottia sp. 7254-16]POZ29879.1 hypothetical protein C3711_01735 [Lelliottia aquatilis]POZ35444.1 hypothetical protein C3710_01735 [Lelliottia aquatilis]